MSKTSPLAGISLEEILVPRPVSYDYEGRPVPVYPMTEHELIVCSDSLDVLIQIAQAAGGMEALRALGGTRFIEAIVQQLPSLVRTAVPAVHDVLKGALRLTGHERGDELVSGIPLSHKVGLLAAVLEAENIGALLKNAQRLAGIVRPTGPADLGKMSPDKTAGKAEAPLS